MTVGTDARSLAGNTSGVGNYLRGVLTSRSFDMDAIGYHASHGEVPSLDGSFSPSSLPAPALADRLLGPATPAWWMNVTLPRALHEDDVSCYFGPNFLKPITCPAPSVVVVHDLVHRVHSETHTLAYRWYLRAFLPISVRTADHVVTVSKSTKRDLQRFHDVPDDRVSVAYPAAADRFKPRGISSSERERLRNKYGLPDDFILFVGNVEPRKNLSNLARAVRALPADVRVPLVVVGQDHVPDPEFDDLLTTEWATDLVHRPGYVPDDDLPLLYNLASVFAYPSVYEGFGIPPLEAMQSGTPVVTSDRSSLPEVVGDAGITVDPTDPDAIASGIDRVLRDEAFATRRRERGLERSTRFSWDETANTIRDRIAEVSEN
ncbi:Glycosyltransferase involved in cell wall bisynthesis [Halogranum rubrum]|uniref:Glycosyltransferase involved in cell wall bisynthesis n=1 Tax=Halogranum rubrum TaxID=553466 RepID=A0A1I4BKL7_9EURY|nr:glycosyltransferase family 1 protein [Halogranum rubrum]SFK69364.1 Glycosyltransferase involved in cell wall bisynthesis [Halogranum rubrum]